MRSGLRHPAFISSLITVLVFAALEGAARIHDAYRFGSKSQAKLEIYRDERLIQRVDDALRRRVLEPYPYVMHRARPDQHLDAININALGFRGPAMEAKKAAGTTRIFLLGGSAAWGAGATSDEATIAATLARRLNAAGGRRFEVINAADSGYQTTQNFIVAWSRVLDLEPDVIVTLDGYNDVYAGLLNREAGFPQNYAELKAKLERNGPLHHLWAAALGPLESSRFLQKASGKLAQVLRPAPRLTAEGHPTVYANPREVARIFGRNLEYLDVLAQSRGVRTLFALQPALGVGAKRLSPAEQDLLRSHDRYIPGYSRYLGAAYALLVEELGRLRAQRRARTLDLVDVFADGTDTAFWDGVHFGDGGHQAIAARLGRELDAILSERGAGGVGPAGRSGDQQELAGGAPRGQ